MLNRWEGRLGRPCRPPLLIRCDAVRVHDDSVGAVGGDGGVRRGVDKLLCEGAGVEHVVVDGDDVAVRELLKRAVVLGVRAKTARGLVDLEAALRQTLQRVGPAGVEIHWVQPQVDRAAVAELFV